MFRFLLELYKIAVTLHVFGNVGDVSSRWHIEGFRSEKKLEQEKKDTPFVSSTFCPNI
jgi:hypothetical protein